MNSCSYFFEKAVKFEEKNRPIRSDVYFTLKSFKKYQICAMNG